MDIKELLAKLSVFTGCVPPGTERLLQIVAEHPKLTIICSTVLVGGILYRYFKHQKYPAPWLDRRILECNLSKKEILETNFKAERACTTDWDVIVIGSGLSGLCTANLLARSGLSVLVLEKHYVAGGCTHVWDDAGREFDTGVHYVGTGTASTDDTTGATLDFLCDGKLRWSSLHDNFDTVVLR